MEAGGESDEECSSRYATTTITSTSPDGFSLPAETKDYGDKHSVRERQTTPRRDYAQKTPHICENLRISLAFGLRVCYNNKTIQWFHHSERLTFPKKEA